MHNIKVLPCNYVTLHYSTKTDAKRGHDDPFHIATHTTKNYKY